MFCGEVQADFDNKMLTCLWPKTALSYLFFIQSQHSQSACGPTASQCESCLASVMTRACCLSLQEQNSLVGLNPQNIWNTNKTTYGEACHCSLEEQRCISAGACRPKGGSKHQVSNQWQLQFARRGRGMPEKAWLVGGLPCGLQGHPGLAKAALQTKGTPAGLGMEVHCLAPFWCPPAG